MKLGLFSMPCHPPRRPHAQTFDEDLELLVLADQLGYDEAWIGEHYSSTWENIPAPDLLIAQAFAVTRTIRLGTGVSCIPNHNPAQLAHRIAQLDVMGKGRFLWGVGVGAFPGDATLDRKSTRLNSSHLVISYAGFCFKNRDSGALCRPDIGLL